MFWIALQPDPEPAPASAAQAQAPELADCLTALGWWALQFTPKVARLEQALVLELSACLRLWGGKDRMVRHMFESNKPLTPVQYAQGATSLIAFARLQAAPSAPPEVDDLPLATLLAARPHLATLARMGCSRWGQLRALPSAGVARRFGAALLDALDRAYGLQPEPYRWLVLPEVFEAALELSAQVETAPALLFGACRLLGDLQVWLRARHCGVLAFELRWTMDARRDTATQGQLVVRTAEPTGELAHLQRLLGEQLAWVRLPAPVLALRLRSLETQKLIAASVSLLPDEQPAGDSLQQLLERLSARLGPQQVLHMQACADHRPEAMQRWQPATSATQLVAAYAGRTGARGQKDLKDTDRRQGSALYPTWLLARPQKLALRHNRPQYQGPLVLLAGPQRLEAGWWGGGECALRDYFLARSPQHGLLWIYRERLLPQGAADAGSEAGLHWYLHGLFA